jgi:hypothetical protein
MSALGREKNRVRQDFLLGWFDTSISELLFIHFESNDYFPFCIYEFCAIFGLANHLMRCQSHQEEGGGEGGGEEGGGGGAKCADVRSLKLPNVDTVRSTEGRLRTMAKSAALPWIFHA